MEVRAANELVGPPKEVALAGELKPQLPVWHAPLVAVRVRSRSVSV